MHKNLCAKMVASSARNLLIAGQEENIIPDGDDFSSTSFNKMKKLRISKNN